MAYSCSCARLVHFFTPKEKVMWKAIKNDTGAIFGFFFFLVFICIGSYDEVGLIAGMFVFLVLHCVASYFRYLMVRDSRDSWRKRSIHWREAWDKSNKDHDVMVHTILRLLPPDQRAGLEGGIDLVRVLAEMKVEEDKKNEKLDNNS